MVSAVEDETRDLTDQLGFERSILAEGFVAVDVDVVCVRAMMLAAWLHRRDWRIAGRQLAQSDMVCRDFEAESKGFFALSRLNRGVFENTRNFRLALEKM